MTCIAICGDSASGKSVFARLLASKLGDSVILECDRYHRWERNHPMWQNCTQLHPTANDLDLLNNDILALKDGKTLWRRNYDHATGKFTAPHEIKPARNIIVCGLHVFACHGDPFDLKIYLDPSQDLKTRWKIDRDTHKRGYTREQVLAQIERRKSDYKLYVEPLRDSADIVINRYEFNGKLCSTMHIQKVVQPDLYRIVLESL